MADLVVFHYHFLPGGVSSVVQAGVRALRQHGAGIGRITLAGAAFPEAGFPDTGAELDCQVRPELGYLERRDPGPAAVASAGRALAESLLQRFGSADAVWWVHNHHLGRNPVFTQAILDVARSGRQRLILQIHDFPECGRYANLARLQRSLASPPYPLGPSVRYALINRRDLAVLQEAGISEGQLWLLENPLELEPGQGSESPAEVKRALGLPAGPRPLLLYPVRCIRRKNVLEAALLCRLAAEPADLAVTLPGVSAAERFYSRQVQKAFARGWAPGVFGAGLVLEAQGLRLEDLLRANDLILCSSVLEGFGYLFLQSLVWGKPLLARDLDVLDGMRDLFAGRPAGFYSEVWAPLGAAACRRLLEAYRAKLRRLAAARVLPAEVTEALAEGLDHVCGGPAVEFSFLPVADQLSLLRAAGRDARLVTELRELNRGPLGTLERLSGEGRDSREAAGPGARELAAQLGERFGPRRFAESFAALCRSFGGKPAADAAAVGEAAIWDRVIRRFATVENARLLHGD